MKNGLGWQCQNCVLLVYKAPGTMQGYFNKGRGFLSELHTECSRVSYSDSKWKQLIPYMLGLYKSQYRQGDI